MPSNIKANARPVLHRGAGHTPVVSTDVCKTPPNAAPVPYPNIACSIDLIDGPPSTFLEGHMPAVEDSPYSRSTGDEAGSMGGVISGTIQGEARFVTGSFDIKIEGRPVVRLGDPMFHNNKNTVG